MVEPVAGRLGDGVHGKRRVRFHQRIPREHAIGLVPVDVDDDEAKAAQRDGGGCGWPHLPPLADGGLIGGGGCLGIFDERLLIEAARLGIEGYACGENRDASFGKL